MPDKKVQKVATMGVKPRRGMSRWEGRVMEALPATTFRIQLDDGREILGHLSGKMRMYYIKIVPGDRVIVEMTAYDDKRGRIVKRL